MDITRPRTRSRTPNKQTQRPNAEHQEKANHILETEELCGDESESSETSSEAGNVDESVREDMLRLEDTFEENGMSFRLIDRIGEGQPTI